MIQYYTSYSDDFIKNKNQSKTISQNYKWIKKNPFYIALGTILFQILRLVGFIYGKIFLHLSIIGKEKMYTYKKDTEQGYYIFGNHTQMLGDVFNPAVYSVARPYYVCDSSNLGIPILGPILPIVGALPIPDFIRGKKKLFDAISKRAKQGKAIVIYPEAHLWPFYTDIRPFDNTAFNFPVRDNLPIFTATTTYQPRNNKFKQNFKKPRVTIYIDGPFYPDQKLEKKLRLTKLHDQVYNTLKSRAANSTVKYIDYKKSGNNS